MNTKRTVAFQVFACLAVFILLFSSVQPVLGAPPRQEVPSESTEEVPAEPAPVESTFAISGKVVDETGAPIAGVSVSDDQGHFALTGEDGAYVLSALQPGARGRHPAAPSMWLAKKAWPWWISLILLIPSWFTRALIWKMPPTLKLSEIALILPIGM